MKSKILIIGQAPPAVNQAVPYDTTLLYEMFSWVNISKEQAQDKFEFESACNVFPGFTTARGHKAPSLKQMTDHWEKTLFNKFFQAKKIIILGKVAGTFLMTKTFGHANIPEIIYLLHPSKRNYSKIITDKENIIKKLNFILNHH